MSGLRQVAENIDEALKILADPDAKRQTPARGDALAIPTEVADRIRALADAIAEAARCVSVADLPARAALVLKARALLRETVTLLLNDAAQALPEPDRPAYAAEVDAIAGKLAGLLGPALRLLFTGAAKAERDRSPLAILWLARELVSDPAAYLVQTVAKRNAVDANGDDVPSVHSGKAVRFTAMAALMRVAGPTGQNGKALAVAHDRLSAVVGQSLMLWDWNEGRGRSQAEALAGYDAALITMADPSSAPRLTRPVPAVVAGRRI